MTLAARAFLAAGSVLLIVASSVAQAPAAEPETPAPAADAPAANEEAKAAEAEAETPAESASEDAAKAARATPKPHAWGNVELDLGAWLATPSGEQFVPATLRNPLNPASVSPIEVETDHEIVTYIRMGLSLPKNIGTLSGSYAAFWQDTQTIRSTPGDFQFGELQVIPYGAGLFEDGYADAFVTDTSLVVRDWQFDLRRMAFDTPRFRGTWHAGIRGLTVRRQMGTTYYSLAPPADLFPPVIPPNVPPVGGVRPDLAPTPDAGYAQSEFSGRGVDAGLDFLFPVGNRGAFSIEAGFSLAVFQGDLTSQYHSTTSSYVQTIDGVPVYLTPPYDELGDNTQIQSITQATTTLSLMDDTGEGGASAMNAYLGFRVRVWRTMSLFAGYRSVRYQDAAAEIRLGTPSAIPSGNPSFVSREITSVSPVFEGLYFGLTVAY